MKEGEVYIHKKGYIFRVEHVYDSPAVMMKVIAGEKLGDIAVDTLKVWEKEKMKKLN